MALYDDRLRQNFIGLDKGAEQYRALNLDAWGVRPEAQEYIKANSTVAWESPERVRGWYWDKQTVIPQPQQAEGTLHELSHVWYDGPGVPPDQKRVLAFQTAVYGTLDRSTAHVHDCEPEMMDFLRVYYQGIGAWLGMFDLDGTGPSPAVTLADFQRKLHGMWLVFEDIANIITWEIFAGLVSYTMGRISEGSRRLPSSMRWLFNEFCTGVILATPRYEGGVP
ncbi:MAG: hypothetical protein WC749_10395 [Dehalococcoidia bacterium]